MEFKLRFKGGTGSGNHGHAGRPGKRGGSMPSGTKTSLTIGGGGKKDWRNLSSAKKHAIMNAAKASATPKPMTGNYMRDDVVAYKGSKWHVIGTDDTNDDVHITRGRTNKHVKSPDISGIYYHDGGLRDRNFNVNLLRNEILAVAAQVGDTIILGGG